MDKLYKNILSEASDKLVDLKGKTFDIIDVACPTSISYAVQLAKVISKLSPLIGNLIEFSTVELLNKYDWDASGKWIRQDPGFPDALFKSETISPNPGIEIKAWFPFATEITARFRDSVTLFKPNHINVALIAWLPEFVIFGKPKIIDVLIVSGKSVAQARDLHYHKPPHYLVLEPENTKNRTGNLQQTNTNGYRIQPEHCNVEEAEEVVKKWGEELLKYSPQKKYQDLIRTLWTQYSYRLDTNYAKIDRIEHRDIEKFKTRVENSLFNGKTIKEWSRILSSPDNAVLVQELQLLLRNK